jgi:5-hydroxyisourate hydrolase
MPPITTHVLDTTLGKPAAGLPLALYLLDGQERSLIAKGITNRDGRVTDWLNSATLNSGLYCLHFDTSTYLLGQNRPVFYPWVDIVFQFETGAGHFHIPLLLSPFGYSTYRGS